MVRFVSTCFIAFAPNFVRAEVVGLSELSETAKEEFKNGVKPDASCMKDVKDGMKDVPYEPVKAMDDFSVAQWNMWNDLMQSCSDCSDEPDKKSKCLVEFECLRDSDRGCGFRLYAWDNALVEKTLGYLVLVLEPLSVLVNLYYMFLQHGHGYIGFSHFFTHAHFSILHTSLSAFYMGAWLVNVSAYSYMFFKFFRIKAVANRFSYKALDVAQHHFMYAAAFALSTKLVVDVLMPGAASVAMLDSNPSLIRLIHVICASSVAVVGMTYVAGYLVNPKSSGKGEYVGWSFLSSLHESLVGYFFLTPSNL